MSSTYYYDMCMVELNKEIVYKRLGKANPSNMVFNEVLEFANRHKGILTTKEYQFLTKKNYKMAHFYTLPKLHKSATVNQLLKCGSEYVHAPDLGELIEARPIVGGPVFYTSGISEMIDKILKPIVAYIPHILQDSFDFIE